MTNVPTHIADAIHLLSEQGYIVLKRTNDRDRDLVVQLRRQGLSHAEIAKEAGLSTAVVYRYLSDAGMTENICKPWTDERLEVLRSLRRAGLSSKLIAQRLETTSDAVRAKCSKDGIPLGKRKKVCGLGMGPVS